MKVKDWTAITSYPDRRSLKRKAADLALVADPGIYHIDGRKIEITEEHISIVYWHEIP